MYFVAMPPIRQIRRLKRGVSKLLLLIFYVYCARKSKKKRVDSRFIRNLERIKFGHRYIKVHKL